MRILKKTFGFCGLVLISLALLPRVWGQWPAPPANPSYNSPAEILILDEVERGIYHLSNEQRRQWGLAPLAWDGKLAALARAHTRDMLLRHFFSHATPEGWSLKERLLACGEVPGRAGENIWSGRGMAQAAYPVLAGTIMAGWMNSPGHREQILDPGYCRLGVGVARLGTEIRATQVVGGQ